MSTRILSKIMMVIALLLSTVTISCSNDENPVESTSNDELTVNNYVIPTTGQVNCYDDVGNVISPAAGEAFYGQDANYLKGAPMSYTDKGDGTITEAEAYCSNLTLGGYDDWRVPNIKELWSIRNQSTGWPYIDTAYFHLVSKDGSDQRQQHTWSSNQYLVNTPEAMKNVSFLVNDWTGHIKALDGRRYVRPVRGDTYGINEFVDNGDSTITDNATGLMWAQNDSNAGMNWEDALAYAENSNYAGYNDWRLPNVKELQAIVDYSGVFPVIDTTIFKITGITNEAGNADYPYFWTSTSAGSEAVSGMYFADYVAFGYAVDHDGNDLHGAGAVRFDTKVKDGPSPLDEERIYNYARLVRDIE